MATIVDIAKQLSLSKSTVSRALSNSPGISEKTSRLVKKTAKEMNYSVNRIAQNLVKKKSQTVGFMIPDISDGFFPSMAIAAENVLGEAGYSVSYVNVQRNPDRAFRFLQTAEEYVWDGIFRP